MIQLAACGEPFNLEMLANIAEQPLSTVTCCLWPALQGWPAAAGWGRLVLGRCRPTGQPRRWRVRKGRCFAVFTGVAAMPVFA